MPVKESKSAQLSEQDKRTAPRVDLERPVQVIRGDAPPLACVLSDISKTGARLTVADASSLPDEFEILFKDDLRKWCRVMRRSEKHVGIKFIHRPQTSPSIVPAETSAPADVKAEP
ncbi:MAG: PilZ domain-containing protein [Xanthobacteraceae bacterium]